MRKVALKGLWLRRGRALLTTIAVVLGVAMVCGTYILTDTIDKAFGSIFSSANAKTSAVVTARGAIQESNSGLATLPSSLLDEGALRRRRRRGDRHGRGLRLRHRPGPARPRRQGRRQRERSKARRRRRVRRFAALEPLHASRKASSLIRTARSRCCQDLAEDEDLDIGDTIGVSAQTGDGGLRDRRHRALRRRGLARWRDLRALRSGDGSTAARQGGSPQHDLRRRRERRARRSSSRNRCRRRSASEVRVRTGDEQAAADSEDIEEALSFIRYFLLAFGFIALGVGAFVIYNTLTITVAQRVRELATLRALGATGRRCAGPCSSRGSCSACWPRRSASSVGYFLAQGLASLMAALGIDLPQTDQVVKPRTIIASVAIGVVVTAIASIAPARRATRISPVAAMQEGAKLPGQVRDAPAGVGSRGAGAGRRPARLRRVRRRRRRARPDHDRHRHARPVRRGDDAGPPSRDARWRRGSALRRAGSPAPPGTSLARTPPAIRRGPRRPRVR